MLFRDPANYEPDSQSKLTLRLVKQQEDALKQMGNIETPVKNQRSSPKVINPRNILFNNQSQNVNVSQEIHRSNGNSNSAGQSGSGAIPKELMLKSESQSSFSTGLLGKRKNKTAMDKRGADRQIKLALTRMSQES